MCGMAHGQAGISQIHQEKFSQYPALHRYIAVISSSRQLCATDQYHSSWNNLSTSSFQDVWQLVNVAFSHCCRLISKQVGYVGTEPGNGFNTFLQSSHVQSLYFKAQWYRFVLIAAVRHCFFTRFAGYTTDFNDALMHNVSAFWDSCCLQIFLWFVTCLYRILSHISKASSLGVVFHAWSCLPILLGYSDPVLDPCFTMDTETWLPPTKLCDFSLCLRLMLMQGYDLRRPPWSDIHFMNDLISIFRELLDEFFSNVFRLHTKAPIGY